MKIITINPYNSPDFLANTILEGFSKIKDLEIIASAPNQYIKNIYNDQEIVAHSKDADYIFIIWDKSKDDRPQPKYYLADIINKPEKTIYIDGSEWTYNGYPNPKIQQVMDSKIDPKKRKGYPWIWEEMWQKVAFYFKRECYQEDIDDFGCIPLPFGILDKYYSNINVKRDIDLYVGFGQNDTGLRNDIENYVKALNLPKVVVNKFPYDQYLLMMARSIMTVDSWGGGDCNARFFEIIANGSTLFCQKYNIIIPYPFVDGETYIEFKNMDEFHEKLHYYLKNIDKALEIGRRGYVHGLTYHTSLKRVEYIFDILKKGKK